MGRAIRRLSVGGRGPACLLPWKLIIAACGDYGCAANFTAPAGKRKEFSLKVNKMRFEALGSAHPAVFLVHFAHETLACAG